MFDPENILRVEIEFQSNTDFSQMRQEYDRELKAESRAVNSPQRSEITLSECLLNYAKPELLDGPDRWLCAKCESPQKAQRLTKLLQSPSCLIVHLKRFKFMQDP